jgi:glucose/arabinose dehydrogenase
MASPAPLAAAALAAAVLVAACGGDDDSERADTSPATTERKSPPSQANGESALARARGEARVETVVTGLEAPWELAFLPDGRALVTERPGRVRLVSKDFELRDQPVAEVEVAQVSESGLLGLAVDPAFERNRFVYLYRTTEDGNEVLRYRLDGERLEEDAVILRDIGAAAIHDGGRLQFGPDRRLYVTTGDAAQQALAQDPGSPNGKVLRLGPRAYRGEGGDPEVFTRGHRNVQGIDWQPGTGTPVATEHGNIGNDEVNVLRKGRNYGWPEVEGEEHGEFTAPVALYPEAIAPSGATFVSLPGSSWTGDYLIAALVGRQIRRLSFDGTRVVRDEALFQDDFGRIRTVVEGPDGALYALTSNRDGRGSPGDDDDRIVRIVPPAG